jgi:glycosyltransferase involved in cell wall biosynthesis
MRVLIVMEYHPDDVSGGSQIQVLEVARELVALGHQVVYLCQRYDRSRPVDEVECGVRVLRALRWHRVFRALALPQVFLATRRLRPDVVYQRYACALTGLAGLSARALGVPFVWGCSQDASLEPGFLRRHAPRPSSSPTERIKGALLAANATLTDVLFRVGMRNALMVFVQNTEQARLLRTHFRREGRLVPNGIRVGPVLHRESERPLVLWLNRVSRGKGAEAFMDLSVAVGPMFPTARFVLVGGRADDAYMHAIRERASRLSSVELTGHVAREEAATWFERASVFVLTSQGEGFPNVLLEAWEQGVPVVSLTVDPDGLLTREGLGVVSGSMERLAEDMARLLTDADERARLGARARQYVEEHFEIGAVARRYEALFAELASPRPEEPAA